MKKVTVEVSRNGAVKVEVHGVVGSSCEDVTRAFEGLGRVTEWRAKPEYFEAPLREEFNTR